MKHIMLFITAAALLSACSYFDAPPPEIEENYINTTGVQVDLMHNNKPSDPQFGDTNSYEDITYRTTDGRVRIYKIR